MGLPTDKRHWGVAQGWRGGQEFSLGHEEPQSLEEQNLKNMVFWNKRKHEEPNRWLVVIAARVRGTLGYRPTP